LITFETDLRTGIQIDEFGNLDIHFLQQTNDVKGAIPLLFVHGSKSHVPQANQEFLLYIL